MPHYLQRNVLHFKYMQGKTELLQIFKIIQNKLQNRQLLLQ
jgi:hypothetical protein